MIAQYTPAGIVSELKRLAVPASVDSIPSSAMQEDHVSMGWAAARKLRRGRSTGCAGCSRSRCSPRPRARPARAARPGSGHRRGAGRAARRSWTAPARTGSSPPRSHAAEALLAAGALLDAVAAAIGTLD